MVNYMKNISIWDEYFKRTKESKKTLNNIKTDILIIGAGITGLTTAYYLKNTDYKITIIDACEVGKGVTAKTTAKISYLEQDIYGKLTKMHSKEIAKKYYESRKEAINLIIKIIKDNHIPCDLEKVTSILFTNDENNLNKLQKEKDILLSYGVNLKDYKDDKTKHAFSVDDTYTFNPVKYLNGLREIIAPKVSIYENTIASNIRKEDNEYIVTTNKGKIKTKKIVLACHYPYFIIPYFFPVKAYIEREYVCASKVDSPKRETIINIDKKLYSVRYYQDYLIYVTHDHRLTSNIDYGNNYQKSKANFIKHFHKEPEYMWMNQDIVSNDELPIIGKIKDNIYISTAYHAWGMTSATIGAKLISDLIQGKDNAYQILFNPKRINILLIINSIIGLFHYLKVYIEGLFHKNNPRYVKIKGIIYGIYTDKEGIEHKVKLICPHMKCPLVFNKEDETWDCPCHGSRFDVDGNIISPPAVKKI